jgi:hypothetical protein
MQKRKRSLLLLLALVCVSFGVRAERDLGMTARFLQPLPFPPSSIVDVEVTFNNLGNEYVSDQTVYFEPSGTSTQFLTDFEFLGATCPVVVACNYYCRLGPFPGLFPGQSDTCVWTFRVNDNALMLSSPISIRHRLSDLTPQNNTVNLVATVGQRSAEPIHALSTSALVLLVLVLAAIGAMRLPRH